VIDSLESLEGLRAAWETLLPKATHASIFMTWEWQCTWWRHYGAGRPLRVIVAEDANGVCAIVPLYVQPQPFAPGLKAAVLRFVGTGADTSPDDLDPLIDSAHAGALAERLAAFVLEELPGWDVLHLTDLHATSSFRMALEQKLANAKRWRVRTGVSARISYLRLPATWDEYLQTLSRDRRGTVRRTRRKVESESGAKFFVWQDGPGLDAAIDRLVVLHRQRWTDKGEAHAFSTSAYVNFHRAVMHACFAQDRLRLYCLEVEGAIIAMYYCYRFENQVFYFQGGFDPAFERLRPGLCLMGYAIEQSIAEGNKIFDMLRGEYDYKRQWAKETRETYFVSAYASGFKIFLYQLKRERWPQWKQVIKKHGRRLRTRFSSIPSEGPRA
jgi:CelD/BcsL family acetyltransferase involved in cellulose biosynthesis